MAVIKNVCVCHFAYILGTKCPQKESENSTYVETSSCGTMLNIILNIMYTSVMYTNILIDKFSKTEKKVALCCTWIASCTWKNLTAHNKDTDSKI